MFLLILHIVFAMRNESTIVISKKIQILFYCFALKFTIRQSNLTGSRDAVLKIVSSRAWIRIE